MKLDWDLVREILIKIESSNIIRGWITIDIPNTSEEVISYHIKTICRGGLIEADNLTDSFGFNWKAKSLTYEGHKFLDAARNKSNWEKAKQYILSKGGSITIDALKIAFSILLKQQLGED